MMPLNSTPTASIRKPGSTIQTCLFWLVVVAFGFLFMVHPKAMDDYWLTYDIFHNAYDDHGFYDFWHGFKEGFRLRYTLDNSRIGNSLAVLALLIPRWIPALASTIVFALGYRLLLRLSQTGRTSLATFTFSTLCLLFFPMWYDSFFVLAYVFNYVWSMTLLFWAVTIFLDDRKSHWLKAAVVGLLLGSWHESFAAAGFTGMMAVLAFKKGMRRPDRWAMVASVAVGSLWLVCFPAWASRLSRESGLSDSSFTHLIFSWGYYLFMAVWILCLCREKWRPLAKSPLPIITAASGIIVLPAVVASGLGRAASPAMMLSAAALPYLATGMFPERFDMKRVSTRIAVCALWVLIIAHLATSCHYIVQVNRSAASLIDQIENHPRLDNTYFIPITETWQACPLAAGKNSLNMFDLYDINPGFIASYYRTGYIRPVPDILKDYREGLGTPLEGNTECRLYKGFIVSPERNYIYKGGGSAVVDYGLKKEFTQTRYAHFTGADGKQFAYVFARRSMLTALLRPDPKGITIVSYFPEYIKTISQ